MFAFFAQVPEGTSNTAFYVTFFVVLFFILLVAAAKKNK